MKKIVAILIMMLVAFGVVFAVSTEKGTAASSAVRFSTMGGAEASDSSDVVAHPVGRPTVAVVLAGGGAKGITHIAMLDELERLGIPIDCVLGTSIGALIGGLYAAGYTPKEITEIVMNNNLMSLFTDLESSGYKELKEPFSYGSEGLSLSMEDGVASINGLIDDYKIMNFFYCIILAHLVFKKY